MPKTYSIEMIRKFFDLYVGSMEDQLNQKYFKEWGKTFNYGAIIEQMVRDRWPELDYHYEEYPIESKDDSTSIIGSIKADDEHKAKCLKIAKYRKRYKTIISNLSTYYPDVLAELTTLLYFGIDHYKRLYNQSLDNSINKKIKKASRN